LRQKEDRPEKIDFGFSSSLSSQLPGALEIVGGGKGPLTGRLIAFDEVTPPKSNMDTQNDGLDKVAPSKYGHFWYLQYVKLPGCIPPDRLHCQLAEILQQTIRITSNRDLYDSCPAIWTALCFFVGTMSTEESQGGILLSKVRLTA